MGHRSSQVYIPTKEDNDMPDYTPHSDATMKHPERFIEDDFKALVELDEQIASLIEERQKRYEIIREQHHRNSARMQNHADWFEGYVRGNPVPDRAGEEAMVDPGSAVIYNKGRW